MKLSDFMMEAHALARTSRVLTFVDDGSEVAGYWYGLEEGRACASIRTNDSWMTIERGLDGPGRVTLDAELNQSGRPMFARSAISLPPIDAIFRFGSAVVGEYLAKNRWQREWEYNDNFSDSEAARYIREWQAQCPIYQKGIVAVTGGWHFPWPDEGWETRVDSELVLWTLEGAEPWIEVFRSKGEYEVFERIT